MTFASPQIYNGTIGNKRVVFIIDLKDYSGHYYYMDKPQEKHNFEFFIVKTISGSGKKKHPENITWLFDNKQEKHKFSGNVYQPKNQVRGSFNKKTKFTINLK